MIIEKLTLRIFSAIKTNDPHLHMKLSDSLLLLMFPATIDPGVWLALIILENESLSNLSEEAMLTLLMPWVGWGF